MGIDGVKGARAGSNRRPHLHLSWLKNCFYLAALSVRCNFPAALAVVFSNGCSGRMQALKKIVPHDAKRKWLKLKVETELV